MLHRCWICVVGVWTCLYKLLLALKLDTQWPYGNTCSARANQEAPRRHPDAPGNGQRAPRKAQLNPGDPQETARIPPGDLCFSVDQLLLGTRRNPLRNPSNIADSLWPFVRLWGPHEINGHRNPPEPARNPRHKSKPLRIRLYE